MSEALLFAKHGENMLCTKIVLNVRNNFCKQHVLPSFELGILFVLSANEYLERLEGKIRKLLIFYDKYSKMTV